MDEKKFLQPLDQLYYLNKSLIDNKDKIESNIITVGGQAVHYWTVYYLGYYGIRPDEAYIASNDVDYSTTRKNVSAMADIFNAAPNFNDQGQPPSIALILLKDRVTHKIKSEDGHLYIDKEMYDGEHKLSPNIVDIIDFPAGFEHDDFINKKLLINTEPFELPIEFETPPEEKIRILNPIACIRSRCSNLSLHIKGNVIEEVERINSLRVPVIVFIIDKFKFCNFREAKRFLYSLLDMLTTDLVLKAIVTHDGIKIEIALDTLASELIKLNGIDQNFITQDLPNRINKVKRKISDKKIARQAYLNRSKKTHKQ